MKLLRLLWLGPPIVVLNDRQLQLEMRKTLALLAYLSLSRQPPTRETLAALFWPEYGQQNALSNLRRNLSSLSNSLPPGSLEVDRERIALRREEGLYVDVDEFSSLLVEVGKHTHPDDRTCESCLIRLEQAVKIYRGDFFAGFNLKDCTEFDDWQFFQREDLRFKYAVALQKLAGYYQQVGEWEKAIQHARAWLALDRLNEPAQRKLMSLYFYSGQKSAALRQYEECVRILEQELDQPPEPETLRIYEEIRAGVSLGGQAIPAEGIPGTPGKPLVIPLIKTKFFIPKLPRTFINRPRLIERLNQSVRLPLTLISASAGFGKSTLLAEWAAQSAELIAWVSLDRGDNDPYRLVDYIVNSIRNVLDDQSAGDLTLRLLRSTQPVQITEIIGSLINDLLSVPRQLVLVLDDYHNINSPAAHEVISYLLDHGSANLHLVISTRADPPLPLARMRSILQLADLRTTDLRFTLQETQLFLTRSTGFSLPDQDLLLFADKVEGWAAGIQMAALAMYSGSRAPSSSELSTFIRTLKGSHRYILDYLLEEVLNRQPDEIQAFLLKTSVLDSMCGPLCDAILTLGEGAPRDGDAILARPELFIGRQSASVLEYLERANLFLLPLDDDRIWYRYHHLFSDLLFQRLQHAQPEIVKDLYLRAAAWQEQNGDRESAIGYALKAKDYDLATRLMDQIKVNLWSHGKLRNLQHWLETMPEELIYSQPELSLDYAACLTLAGYFDDAEKWLRITEEGYSQVSPTCPQLTLRAKIMVPLYRSASARFHGEYSKAIDLCEQALTQLPDTEVRYKGVTLLFLGQAHFYAGDMQAAEQVLSDAIQTNRVSGHNAAYLGVCHDMAQVKVLQGRLHEARDIYEQASRWVNERGITVYAGTEFSGLGDLKREWNQLTAAADDIQKGIEFAETSDHVFFMLDVYLARVRLALAQRDWEAGWSYLQKAEKVVRRCPTSVEIENIRTWQARAYLAQGNLAQAEQWAEKKQVEQTASLGPHQELELLTLARTWLALGKTDQATFLLEHIRQAAGRAGRGGRALEAHMLQAIAYLAGGRETQAVTVLSQVLAQAEPEGYVRLFIDEGAPMQHLLARWLTQANRGALRDYGVFLISQFDSLPP